MVAASHMRYEYMRYYRFYFLGSTGHIEDVRECMADDDDAAMIEARSLELRAPIEVWCQGRKIADMAPLGLVAAF